MLGGQRNQRDPKHRQRGLVTLTEDEEVVAALAMESDFRRSFDGVGRAEPGARGRRRLYRPGRKDSMQHCILAHVSRSIAFEHDRSGLWRGGLLRATADFLQPLFTFFLGKPDDLKRTVAFNGAGSVVVDGFARSR